MVQIHALFELLWNQEVSVASPLCWSEILVVSMSIFHPRTLCFFSEEVDIVAQPESNEFEEGDTVTLTCVGYGTPDNPTITWSREGRVIGATSTVRIYQQVLEQGGVEFVLSNLEICGILLEQAGIYSCTATLQSGPTHTTSDFWVNITHARKSLVNKIFHA